MHPSAGIREATLVGVRWTAGTRVAAELVAVGSSLLLARLVAPREFGAAVLALFLNTLAVVVREQAVSVPLVQRAAIDRRHLETAVALSLGIGVAGVVVVFALAPILWRPVFGAHAATLALVASAAFPLAAVAAIGQAQLQRALAFRVISLAELAGVLLGLSSAVLLALAGLQGLALVLGNIVAVAVSAIVVLASTEFVWPKWHRAAAVDLRRVGGPGTVAAISFTTFRSVDYFIIGAFFNLRVVGIYWRAFQLAVEYQGKLTGIMLRVAFPLYSRLDDAARRAVRARVVRLHAAMLFPLLALLFVTAPTAIPFLYGDAWREAAPLTRILCIGGIGAVLATGLGPLLQALGRVRALMVHTLVCLALLVATITILAPYGITVVAWGVSATHVLIAIGANYFLGSRIAGIPARDLLFDIAAPTFASAVLIAVSWPLLIGLASVTAPAGLTLALVSLAGLTSYGIAIRVVSPQTWRDVFRVLGRREPEPTSPQPDGPAHL